MDLYPTNVSFYNFTAIHPPNGTCEWQQFGNVGPVKDVGSTVLGILTALQGIFGLVKSRSVTIGTKYLFSLLLGFGWVSSAHSATLWNGFDKTRGAMLNLMQAVVITRLIWTMKFPPFTTTKHYYVISSILLTTFGYHPIFAHVIGSSFDNPWVSYLTYDLIWIPILIIGLTIFFNRQKYPQFQTCPEIYSLVFNALTSCVLAYTFWLIDTFLCSRAVAILQCYGLWIFFKGLTFYYLAVLDGFLQSYWDGYKAVVTRWPTKYIIVYASVSWTKLNPSTNSEEGRSVERVPLQQQGDVTLP